MEKSKLFIINSDLHLMGRCESNDKRKITNTIKLFDVLYMHVFTQTHIFVLRQNGRHLRIIFVLLTPETPIRGMRNRIWLSQKSSNQLRTSGTGVGNDVASKSSWHSTKVPILSRLYQPWYRFSHKYFICHKVIKEIRTWWQLISRIFYNWQYLGQFGLKLKVFCAASVSNSKNVAKS